MKITRTDGGSGTANDVIVEFQKNGTTTWVMGLDDTDNNLFKIHSGTELDDESDFVIDKTQDPADITKGEWNATPIEATYLHDNKKQGTAILSTGESGGNKFLREDGDGTCSWQSPTFSGGIDDLSDAKSGGTNFTNSVILGHTTTGTLSSANNNTAIGIAAMDAITSGTDNTIVGYQAGTDLTTGANNVFIGYQAADDTVDVDKAVIIGSGAGSANMTSNSDGCVGIGYQSLAVLTDAPETTAIGYQALIALVGNSSPTDVAKGNTAVGVMALSSEPGTSSGYKNTAIGRYALKTQNESYENVAVGYDAGLSVAGSDGNQMVLIGRNAGADITTGLRNICFGYDAGQNLTTGNDCIYIGHQATASASGVTGEIVIGSGLTGKGSNTTFIGGAWSNYNGANTTTWSEVSSDRRLKRNIENIDIGLNDLNKLRIVKYQFKNREETPKYFGYDSKKKRYGIIAQEARDVLPGIVSEDKDGWLSSNADILTWTMGRATQELSDIYDKQYVNDYDELLLLEKKQQELQEKYLNILNMLI